MWAPKLRTPGMACELLGGVGRDAHLLGQRGARLGHPVHQEVPLLEAREQLLAEAGHDDEAGDGDDARDARRPGIGLRTIGVQEPPVAGLEPAHERARRPDAAWPGRTGSWTAPGSGSARPPARRARRGRRRRPAAGRTRRSAPRGRRPAARASASMNDAYTTAPRTSSEDSRMIDAFDCVAALRGGQAEPSHDVLDVDDGVVDDGAERDHEAGQHHRVDGGAAGVQHQPGRDQRHAGW